MTEDQIASEVESLLKLVQRVYADFGLESSAKLSTRPEEFLGEMATWDHAETALRRALESAGQAYTINAGDGAFYGPKVDSTSPMRWAANGSARRFNSTTRSRSGST